MKKFVIITLCLLAFSCQKRTEGQKQEIVSDKNAKIELVAEVDSIKVYKFYNGSSIVFFTNKGTIAIR